ncbi:MAG TPA: dihydropteroate synthase [Hyphomicrobiaceae bacterium]
MAQSSIYVRPTGRFAPGVVGSEHSGPGALRVAGRGDLLFAAGELIERKDGNVSRRIVPAAELLAGDLALPELMAHLCRPREPIAGLALDRPRLMGIVNVTPDSFSDAGQFLGPEAAIEHALRLEAEGADIIDVGAESTRPGSDPVSLDEELRRTMPVLEGLASRLRVPLSVDTRKAEVMRRAAGAGARLLNDVSALAHDPRALEVAGETGLPVVLMHAQGDPRTMQVDPRYDDVVLDVYDWLAARIEACERAGIPRARLVVDPGIGFGKTLAHNLALIGASSIFHGLGCAILLGASRKSFIARLAPGAGGDRLGGSIAAALAGAAQGVQILRVHDVAATHQALAVWEASLTG